MPSQLFSVEGAARALKLRYQVTRRLILTKKMAARKLDGRYLVTAAEIARVRHAKPWRSDCMRRYRK